jgi:CheY-like chemotaxis protein
VESAWGALSKKTKTPFLSASIRSIVVDDDGVVLNYVAQMLSMLGYPKVETAPKMPKLINQLRTGHYYLMVADLEMPDMNGFHFLYK